MNTVELRKLLRFVEDELADNPEQEIKVLVNTTGGGNRGLAKLEIQISPLAIVLHHKPIASASDR